MTSADFTAQHGDPATWSTNDYEAQQNLAACDHHDIQLAVAANDIALRLLATDRLRPAA